MFNLFLQVNTSKGYKEFESDDNDKLIKEIVVRNGPENYWYRTGDIEIDITLLILVLLPISQ